MPATYGKQKMYGTVRRATVKKSFRGSVQAWDMQRKQSTGLLRQQPPAPSSVNKENQQPSVRRPAGLLNDDDDDDELDSFVLESPPESPVCAKITDSITVTPIQVKIDTSVKSVLKQAERKEVLQSEDHSSMPKLAARKPLAPKTQNVLNIKTIVTPKKSKPVRQKSKKPKEKEQDAAQTVQLVEEQASAEPQLQDISVVSTPDGTLNDLPHTVSRRISGCDIPSVDARSNSAEICNVELLSSRIEKVEIEHEVTAAECESRTVDDLSDEQEEEEEEEDDSVVLSPQQRQALKAQLRKQGGRKYKPFKKPELGPLSPVRLQSELRLPDEPIRIQPNSESTGSLSPESKVFSFLESCDIKSIVTYEEYLKTISSDFSGIKKIGQSSFAEVFLHRRDDGVPVVLKLVPLEDEDAVVEILQELKITKTLSPIEGFIKYVGCQVVSGGIPKELDAAWRQWEQEMNEDGDYRTTDKTFNGVDHHIIIALEDGGCQLDDCRWKTWDVPLEIFRQTLCALAEAEKLQRFEHRDLHGGNLLVRNVNANNNERTGEGEGLTRKLELQRAQDVKVTLIDYTLSRADIPEEHGGGIAAIKVAATVFLGQGLYQFDMYRYMADEMRVHQKKRPQFPPIWLDWSNYCPRTNVVWLHYLLHMLVREDGGKRNTGKLHIRKPRMTKKNVSERACWESLMEIQRELEYDAELSCGVGFRSAGEVLEWCEKNNLFSQLGADVPMQDEKVVESVAVQPRRSGRIRGCRR